jgi:nucleotide-binding universal stress UspA family protein
MTPPTLEHVLTLALQLSPVEQAKLVGEVASHLAEQTSEKAADVADHNWGQRLVALVNSLDTSAWNAEEFADPVEWLKRQRQQQFDRYQWGEEE